MISAPSPEKPLDSGPVYTETDLDQFIAEPFNAVSAFLFVLLVLYWWWKIRRSLRQHLFMAVALPVLLTGGVGGTLCHAFRNSEFFLVMDWLPIMLLTLSASGYFIYLLTGSRLRLLLIIALFFLLQWLNFKLVPRFMAVNVSYVLMAFILLLPLLLLLRKTRFVHGRYILLAFISFALAIGFRIADPLAWVSMGTHFLWHVFGALACHFVLGYLYCLKERA